MITTALLPCLLGLCTPLVAGDPPFEDISARALPGVETHCGSSAKDWILEVNGGGVLLSDLDGDGKCDLVIIDGSTLERATKGENGFPPRVFLGNGDGTFRPAGAAWAMTGGRFGTGGAIGDVDGDGWPDIVVTQWGPTRLFHNDAGKGLTEITASAGFGAGSWGTSAAFLDYDRDGKLDLFVANYLDFDPHKIPKKGAGSCRWKGHDVMCGPEGLTPIAAQLFRGHGDGTFEDATAKAGLVPEHPAFGLGVMTLDYDNDGDTDVFVTNDSMPNHLWENQGDGTFKEVGWRRGVSLDSNGREQASMGIAVGDWNADGRDDLFVTNFSGETNSFYVSTKSGGFRERSSATGLAGPSLPMLGWGTGMFDIDLDGDLDLYVVNGHVYPEADQPGTDTSYAEPDQWYENDGQGRFTCRALSNDPPTVSRASAQADLDGDGDLDLVVLRVDGAVRVLRNRAQVDLEHHWLRVELRSKSGNRFGLGARVTAEWEGGSRSTEIRTAGGFQAAVPAEAHFGLGKVAKLTRLRVRWPAGEEQILEDIAVDRLLRVQEKLP